MRILLLALCLTAACAAPNDQPPPPDTPWRVSIGTFGGVTGGGGGVELWSDGSLFTHRRDTPHDLDGTTYLGRVDQADVQRVARMLGEATTIEQRQWENMTTSLTWQGLDHGFRHDWSWEMGDDAIPRGLRALEAELAPDRLHAKPGTPPVLLGSAGRADQFIGTDGQFVLTLRNANGRSIQAVGRGANTIASLKGMTLALRDAEGHLTVDDVQHGWVSGTLILDGEESSFRLPTWLEIAP